MHADKSTAWKYSWFNLKGESAFYFKAWFSRRSSLRSAYFGGVFGGSNAVYRLNIEA